MCSSGTRKSLNSEQSHKEEDTKSLSKTYSKNKFRDAAQNILSMENYVKDKKRVRDHNGYRRRSAGLCIRELHTSPFFDEEFEILLVSGRADKDYWVLPGGGVEELESNEQAVVREFKEEAGVQATIIAKIGEFTVSFKTMRV